MKTIVEEGAQKLGGCDIFVQCAVSSLSRIYEHALATEVPLEKWQRGFESQARSFFVGAPLAAKHMRSGGRILALSYNAGATTGGWQAGGGRGVSTARLRR